MPGHLDPTDPANAVEAKVKAASVAALAASVTIALLNGLVADSTLLGAFPPWLQGALIIAVPTVVTFLAGYVKTSNRV